MSRTGRNHGRTFRMEAVPFVIDESQAPVTIRSAVERTGWEEVVFDVEELPANEVADG